MTDTPEQIGATQVQILQHSLGLTNGRKMYRNHFVTGEGSLDYPDCMALVSRGLMTRQNGNALTGGDYAFFVTDAGKAVAQAALPKLSRSKERYRQYLDADCGLSFGDWLKSRAILERTSNER